MWLPLLLLAAGCANPGPPRPPSLHLPAIIQDLHAARLGDQVVLTWTTPASTTDGGTLHTPLTASLCRDLVTAQATAHPVCTIIQRLPIAPGSAHAADTLPPALLTALAPGAPYQLLTYRVQLLNREGRTAGPSAPVFTAAGPSLAPLTGFTVTSTRAGALLTWLPAPQRATVEISRTAPKNKPVLLETAQSNAQSAPDHGGAVDHTPLDLKFDGIPFTYTAQRVLALTLAVHPPGPGINVELRGLPSPPVAFTFHNTFPPDAPTGLLTIPALSPPAIDLSWEAPPAQDLLGYNVYRRDPAHPFALLNPKPLLAPSFRDLTVHPNIPYTYRVTALDRHHNQSLPSVEVHEILQP